MVSKKMRYHTQYHISWMDKVLNSPVAYSLDPKPALATKRRSAIFLYTHGRDDLNMILLLLFWRRFSHRVHFYVELSLPIHRRNIKGYANKISVREAYSTRRFEGIILQKRGMAWTIIRLDNQAIGWFIQQGSKKIIPGKKLLPLPFTKEWPAKQEAQKKCRVEAENAAKNPAEWDQCLHSKR